MDQTLYAILPQVLQNKKGEIALSQVKDESPLIALYFSAHWCPPCRMFTPKLAEFYKTVNKNKKEIEIIFVSLDQNEDQFKEYYESMPWITVPYESDNRELLSDTYGIQGIPALLVFKNNGKLIDKNGRNTIMSKQNGAIDQWKSAN
jgi:nucleoredoxin